MFVLFTTIWLFLVEKPDMQVLPVELKLWVVWGRGDWIELCSLCALVGSSEFGSHKTRKNCELVVWGGGGLWCFYHTSVSSRRPFVPREFISLSFCFSSMNNCSFSCSQCNSQLKTKAYGIDTATFAKEHALLSGVVPPKSDKPLFVKHNVRWVPQPRFWFNRQPEVTIGIVINTHALTCLTRSHGREKRLFSVRGVPWDNI